MTLTQAQINKTYTIKAINAPSELKQRLISFGIVKNADILYLSKTKFSNTYKISIGNTLIALRKEEADSIEIA